MLLALSEQIEKIDRYSSSVLGIPLITLMERSGRAVAGVLRENVKEGARVVILAGGGNNGGDGYALASIISEEYDCTVFDVFCKGQRSDEGIAFRDKYIKSGGKLVSRELTSHDLEFIKNSDCIVDAVFGTGFKGAMPKSISSLIACINSSTCAYKIAIDVPLGVNADDGSISESYACSVDVTVALSFIKPGLVCYPARPFVGRIVYDSLGLPKDRIMSDFSFRFNLIDGELASSMLPVREENGSKGSFGKLLSVTGSDKYRGAAHLSLEAALRGGVGLVTYYGTGELCRELSMKYPEAIYHKSGEIALSDTDVDRICELSSAHTAVLIGSGSSVTSQLYLLVKKMLKTEGPPVILDADAINALAENREEALLLLKNSPRRVVLTPHPLEFARLYGTDVASVQSKRTTLAIEFAASYNVILVLKGAGTIVTDGEHVYINSTGSSALSKAGSGDVLAGFLASVVASGADCLSASSLSVYYHGLAADALACQLSAYGVTPSDLPREIARQLALR